MSQSPAIYTSLVMHSQRHGTKLLKEVRAGPVPGMSMQLQRRQGHQSTLVLPRVSKEP